MEMTFRTFWNGAASFQFHFHVNQQHDEEKAVQFVTNSFKHADKVVKQGCRRIAANMALAPVLCPIPCPQKFRHQEDEVH